MAEWKKVVVSGSSAELSGLTVDNTIVGSIDGNAATVTTNANLTGDVTSVGNATTIANGAVETVMIADSNVTTAKINADAVTNAKIADNAVDTENIADDAITAALIDDLAVGTAALAANAVTTAKITDANVTAAKLATDAVTTAKITDANVTTAKIADNAITTAKLDDSLGTLTGQQFTGSFTGSYTGDGSGLTGVTGEIDIDSLSAGTTIEGGDKFVYSDGGTEKSITYGIVSGSILSSVSGDITATTAGVVTIGNDKVTQAKIADDAVGADQLAANAVVNASIDASAAIDFSKLAALTSANLLVGNGSNVATSVALSGDATISNAGVLTIGNNAITTAKINADAVTNAKIADDAVDTENIADDAITAALIDDLAVGTAALAANAVTTAKITDSNVTAAKIGSNAVTTVKINDGAVTSAKLDSDITISNNLTVNGDLQVAGTASFNHSTNLAIADKYILLNSGSSGAGDGGFVVEQSGGGTGELFGFDKDSGTGGRWGIASNFNADTSGDFTPTAFMSTAVVSSNDDPDTAAAAYKKEGNIYIDTTNNIPYIYC